jgi:hypothetical protein
MITILLSLLGLSIFRLGKIGGWNAQIATVMVPTAIRQMPRSKVSVLLTTLPTQSSPPMQFG